MVSLPATGGALMTWAGVRPLVAPLKLTLPAYSALTECEPRARVLIVKLATPPDKAAEPATLPSMRKSTVPVGVPAPGATAATVIAKVTLAPGRAGLADELMAPRVADGRTLIMTLVLTGTKLDPSAGVNVTERVWPGPALQTVPLAGE